MNAAFIIIIDRFGFAHGEFLQTKFVEAMIDHLDIESKIIIAESDQGRSQVAKYGVAPPIGNKNTNPLNNYNFQPLGFVEEKKNDDEVEEVNDNGKNEKAKVSNQFHFIERATQTKSNDIQDSVSQTDPPPM